MTGMHPAAERILPSIDYHTALGSGAYKLSPAAQLGSAGTWACLVEAGHAARTCVLLCLVLAGGNRQGGAHVVMRSGLVTRDDAGGLEARDQKGEVCCDGCHGRGHDQHPGHVGPYVRSDEGEECCNGGGQEDQRGCKVLPVRTYSELRGELLRWVSHRLGFIRLPCNNMP